MKKIFSLFVAALLSVSMFASKDSIPTDQVLADYYETGQLCVCVFFEGQVCNDIVWAGTYNAWGTNPAEMTKFQEVDGYDGWYVVAVDDSTDPSTGDGICGKPVQLKSDGSFSWDYQTGDAESWTLKRGSVNIIAGFSGEADLKGWSTAQPNVLISASWKKGNTPCVTVPKHKYTIKLNAPLCADAEGTYFAPAIIGAFNGWSEGVTMELDEQTFIYSYVLDDEEGHEFKFKALGDTDWSNQIQIKNESGAWIDNPNITLPKATKDTTLEIDYSEGKYTLCVATCDSITYTVTVIVPECTSASAPQVMGSFNGWSTPVAMTATGNKNEYTAQIFALCSDSWKINDSVLGWDNEIKKYNAEKGEWEGAPNNAFGDEATVPTVDYSDTKTYSWTLCASPVVEVKAANAAAKKVIVNGQIVIIRDGAQFNVLGTEVK